MKEIRVWVQIGAQKQKYSSLVYLRINSLCWFVLIQTSDTFLTKDRRNFAAFSFSGTHLHSHSFFIRRNFVTYTYIQRIPVEQVT